jgi:hypothetical protein
MFPVTERALPFSAPNPHAGGCGTLVAILGGVLSAVGLGVRWQSGLC